MISPFLRVAIDEAVKAYGVLDVLEGLIKACTVATAEGQSGMSATEMKDLKRDLRAVYHAALAGESLTSPSVTCDHDMTSLEFEDE